MSDRSLKSLEEYVGTNYPYQVTEDDGEFVISFPDLPGCITQVERAEEINTLAKEIKSIWLESAWESGHQIPLGPAQDFSGKFMVRIPKSLHRDLTNQARDEGMSLNSFVMHLLSSNSIRVRLETLLVSEGASQQRLHHGLRNVSSNHSLQLHIPDAFNPKDSGGSTQLLASVNIDSKDVKPPYNFSQKPGFEVREAIGS